MSMTTLVTPPCGHAAFPVVTVQPAPPSPSVMLIVCSSNVMLPPT
jgi:hypothetical protein